MKNDENSQNYAELLTKNHKLNEQYLSLKLQIENIKADTEK